ncbi:MAG TPA: hypothetical protein VK435_00180 [Thermodesulfovibrionales bacterium]|nr:hypothetical protein [Thermodesulfovibrionales bacterium]
MALEDIERLKEKISRDPNSKLFVPLAEEYKKAGMLDEAIEVLTTGLEHQPGYLSARVSLGKIFIDRGLLHEAQAEFEKVIGAIPDNLYAHKKLAEIYRDLGEKEKAVREFNMVLKLNPLDEWASSGLSELEMQPAAKIEEPPVKEPETPSPAEIHMMDEYEQVQEGSAIESETPPAVTPEEVDTESLTEIPLDEEAAEEQFTFVVPSEEPAGAEIEIGELSLGEEAIEAIPSDVIPGLKDEETVEPLISREDADIWKAHAESVSRMGEGEAEPSLEESGPDLWKPLYETQGKEEAGPDAAEEITMTGPVERGGGSDIHEDETLSFDDAFAVAEPTEKELAGIEEKDLRGDEGLTIGNADKYIMEGKYFSAMNIYRKILSRDTANKQVLQRIEELRVLLKLLGKDKEELVSKLDGFLDGIRKRRDEFSGNT